MIESTSECGHPKTVICTVSSILDYRNAPGFKAQVDNLLNMGVQNAILDLSETHFIDSAGLGAIFSLHRRLGKEGGRVLIATPSPYADSLMAMTQCNKVFGSYGTISDAVDAVRASEAAARGISA